MLQAGVNRVHVGRLYFVHKALLKGIHGEASLSYVAVVATLTLSLTIALASEFRHSMFCQGRVTDTSYVMGGRVGVDETQWPHSILLAPTPTLPSSGGGPSRGGLLGRGVGASVLSQQQTSASAFITQHQHSSPGQGLAAGPG